MPGTELSAAPTSLSGVCFRTEAKESTTPEQTLLVLLAQAGDRTALEQLLHEAYAPLRCYITRLAGADLADDILQETSIQIFRKLQSSSCLVCWRDRSRSLHGLDSQIHLVQAGINQVDRICCLFNAKAFRIRSDLDMQSGKFPRFWGVILSRFWLRISVFRPRG